METIQFMCRLLAAILCPMKPIGVTAVFRSIRPGWIEQANASGLSILVTAGSEIKYERLLGTGLTCAFSPSTHTSQSNVQAKHLPSANKAKAWDRKSHNKNCQNILLVILFAPRAPEKYHLPIRKLGPASYNVSYKRYVRNWKHHPARHSWFSGI